MRLSGQFQIIFFFFLQKGFEHKKRSQAKINQQKKIKQTLNSKGNIFMRGKTSKTFRKQKKNKLV